MKKGLNIYISQLLFSKKQNKTLNGFEDCVLVLQNTQLEREVWESFDINSFIIFNRTKKIHNHENITFKQTKKTNVLKHLLLSNQD